MTDTRRALLWGIFLVSLVMLWDGWNRHQGLPSMFGPQPPAATHPAAANGGTPPAPGSDVPSVAAGAAGASGPAAASVPGTAVASAGAGAPLVSSETVTITTDLFKATLDSRGGSLVRLELTKQRELVQHAWYEPFVALFTTADQPPREGGPVVLFDHSAQRTYLARTGLAKVGGAVYPNHESPMKLLPGDRNLADGQNELVVRFESEESGGVQLTKTYTFKRGDYSIGVRHDIANHQSAPLSPHLYTELVRDGTPPPGESSFYFTFTGPAVYTDAHKFQKVEFSAIDKRGANETPSHATSAPDGWIAMIQHYFASAWLVPAGTARQFHTSRISNSKLYSVTMMMALEPVAAGATGTFNAQLFAGPQEENRLAELAPGLELVKDYGWFKILAQPLYRLLTWLHAAIGNWGWAIVALVLLLKIAFYWLNASAYRSMAKMKAVNPRVMELRERYKDNPQQMQQEMMRLYREEKVNPIGGCLPILVQMPFFIALYWVLLSSVEMRNAPWIGWINDLSAIDPYYILPLLMTASTMFQTWLNPTPPDPMQARMMWIMPLVFSVMFFFFPAGLVLYWLTNNILSIAQQWFINKKLGVNK
jgi:YidC/Oxa1 family membrane protein insertase